MHSELNMVEPIGEVSRDGKAAVTINNTIDSILPASPILYLKSPSLASCVHTALTTGPIRNLFRKAARKAKANMLKGP